jgi:hypothetical protein
MVKLRVSRDQSEAQGRPKGMRKVRGRLSREGAMKAVLGL